MAAWRHGGGSTSGGSTASTRRADHVKQPSCCHSIAQRITTCRPIPIATCRGACATNVRRHSTRCSGGGALCDPSEGLSHRTPAASWCTTAPNSRRRAASSRGGVGAGVRRLAPAPTRHRAGSSRSSALGAVSVKLTPCARSASSCSRYWPWVPHFLPPRLNSATW